MTTHLAFARQHLLEPAELTEAILHKVLGGLLGRQAVDAADIYLQHAQGESWLVEKGAIKTGSHHIVRGMSVRAMAGEKTGFAYADSIALPALTQTSAAAGTIAHQGQQGGLPITHLASPTDRYEAMNPLQSLTTEKKTTYLLALDRRVRALDPRIIEVNISLAANYEVVMVLSETGAMVADVRPLVRLNVSVIAEHKGRREQGSAGGGGRFGYDQLLAEDKGLEYGKEAARKALLNLGSVNAPAGLMPVILGPGWPGVLLHEAVGHGLEGDFNRKGQSEYSGRIGEQVASKLCTVVDDGTLPKRRGSLNVDDEGTPTGYTVLIENGILKGYMQDKQNARLMGQKSTGNGRRESYSHPTMPRMTNTYMLAGESDPDEMIRSVKRGLYAVDFGGGSVDITSGDFVFSATEAYLIEDGRIKAPVKGATLIGKGPEVMSKISMVGNDLKLDSGVGVCGKDGQSVPVGVGQPTLKIDAMTVGGTQS